MSSLQPHSCLLTLLRRSHIRIINLLLLSPAFGPAGTAGDKTDIVATEWPERKEVKKRAGQEKVEGNWEGWKRGQCCALRPTCPHPSVSKVWREERELRATRMKVPVSGIHHLLAA